MKVPLTFSKILLLLPTSTDTVVKFDNTKGSSNNSAARYWLMTGLFDRKPKSPLFFVDLHKSSILSNPLLFLMEPL